MADTIHIACATDANYLPHCAAMLRSAARHDHGAPLCIHIIHDGIAEADRDIFDACVPIDTICWHQADSTRDLATPQIGHISAATYLRLQLDRLIAPEIKRILYLDVDMIVSGSLRMLWETRLDGKSLAAVPDAWIDPVRFSARYGVAAHAYFNAGMLLLDIDRIRDSGGFAKTLAVIAEQGEALEFSDQDALNLVFWNDWVAVDRRWNFQRIHLYQKPLRAIEAEFSGLPTIIHFTESVKPWRPDEWHPYRWIYWHHLLGTPFFNRVRREQNVGWVTLARSWAKFFLVRKIK